LSFATVFVNICFILSPRASANSILTAHIAEPEYSVLVQYPVSTRVLNSACTLFRQYRKCSRMNAKSAALGELHQALYAGGLLEEDERPLVGRKGIIQARRWILQAKLTIFHYFR
jgi:hypothetical protein